ncbi:MAG: TolC family protein, partial [Bacteroidota bacterium]
MTQETWDLQRCVEYALENNLQVKQSELSLELNEINQQRNFGAFLPSLNASASHGYNWGQTIDPFTNQFATERIRSNSFGIGTNLTIFNGFQNLNNYKQGLTNIQASQADLDALRNDIALNVANNYLNVLFNQELLKIAQFNVEATQDQTDRIQKLVDAGAAPQGDSFDIQSQLATDQASLVTAENNLKLAKLALVQLLQLDAAQTNSINIVSPDLGDIDALVLPPSSQDAIVNALANFPQMRSARLNTESAAQGLDVAKGTRMPNLSMSFNYGTGFSGNNQVPVGDAVLDGEQIIGVVE